MALITVDPSQKKTVVALLGVLVVAVGVTIIRIEPTPEVEPAAQQQAQQAAEKATCPADEPECDRVRNPFERPESFGAAGAGPISTGPDYGPSGLEHDRLLAARRQSLGTPTTQPFVIQPLPVIGPSGLEQGSLAAGRQTTPRAAQPRGASASVAVVGDGSRPRVTLLATIRNPRGYSAVIRVNESATQVVEIGDVVAGGFRVTILTEDHAALSDGRETIVAKRPHL